MMAPKFLWIFVLVTNFVSYISCENGISLAFAIDDTRSMWDDIAQVKEGAKAIMQMVINTKSSEVENFVLVTINDPDVILRTNTTSHSNFLAALNRIKVHNYRNYDCEERALAGIEKALKFSKPESYIYVFTDASTKELGKLNSITRLCQKKQSQVVFVLTGDCGQPSSRRFTVYYDIAKACSGQVFPVKKEEVHSVLKTIELLLKGKNSIFKWETIPKTNSYYPVPFTLDEKAEYAIVSTSGKNVKLRITTTDSYFGSEPVSERTMWNDNGKVVKLVNPKPGTYYAWVKGDSTISVVVYGRTDFTFGHGFSVLEPKSMKDTAKQPIAGLKQHLSINVTDPDHSVDIKSAQILDIKNNDNVTNELPLRNIGDNVYITEAFVLPNETFKITVKGEVKKTHETITRNSRNIDPQIVDPIPESIPDVKIDEETSVDVNYGSAVSLTCKVTAHPAPKIEWYSSSGVLLPSNSAVLEDPVFVSYLKLSNVTRDESYVCKASNKKGAGNDSKIKVSVRPVFTDASVSEEAVKNVKYGEDVKIPCNIKSYLPITIRWFRSGKQLSGNSGEHSISPDGSVLTLKSMNIEMQGKYTCETTLNLDPAIKQARDIEVKIPELGRPEIQSTTNNKTLMKGDTLELNCKIARGYPKPYVKWFKKIASSYESLAFVNSEVLTVNNALFSHAGQYKCEAINAMGTDTATFEVTVNSLPVVTIAGATTEVAYDSHAEYTCKVESHPAPKIVWKDEKGSVLQNKVTQIAENNYSSQLKLNNITRSAIYTCLASNSIGSKTDQVKFTVLSPFVVKSHINETIEINYGSKHTLVCDVKSASPIGMRWLKQDVGANSSKSVFTAFDGYTSSGDGTRLTILSMDLSKAGKYTCEYVLLSDRTEKVAFSATVKVVGLIVPKVTNSTVLNGKNFTAICRIEGVPKPIISWQFKQNGSEEFTPIPGSGEELNIPELKLKHTGVYKCIAKNDLGSTQHDFDLVVKEPPTITNEDPNYYAVEGDLVMKIPCDVTGYPEPTIVWKNGEKALKMDSKYMIKGTTLYVNKPVHADPEEYTCEATNALGTTTKKFLVEVVASFDSDENFSGVTQDIYAEQGKPKSVKCNLKNLDDKSVRWYMDGVLTNKTGSIYTIERASILDEGNYTCRVNIDEGSRSETYVLYVGYPPFFEDNSPSPITIDWQYGYQMLDCAADSLPSPQYKWLHNGKVESGKKSPQIPITDWGKYACQVSNVHGNISKTFEVGSSGCYLTMNVLTQNQPLVSELDIPSWPSSMGNSDILLMENEEIKLSCPNDTKSSNAFKIIPNKQEVIAKCNTEDKFTVDGKTYRYSELQCNTKVEPLVLGTRRQCSGPNSELIRVGFEVNGFLDTYRVCFDRSLNVPLYAQVWTLAPRTGDGVDSTKFNWSSTPEVGIRNLGLKTEGWNPKENCKCCYTKGQLMNVNELAFGPAQSATFKESLNSIPIWNPSCDDNTRTSWQAFDDEIRAMSLLNKWSIWTGASEWTPTKIGLAPRFLWKALNYDEGSTVMVYVNDKSPVDSDIRCSDPCELMMEADPFLYCCTLDEFSKKFSVPIETFQPV